MGGIQDGDEREEADSMNSVNKKSCWDAGATLGRKKLTRRSRTLTQSFSMPHYTEKQGGILCRQTPTPNLLGRCKPIGEQISSMRYSYSHPWDKPAEHPGQTDPSHRKGSETAQRGIMRRQKRDGNHSPPKIN
jgi:hypothetical protein